MDVLQQVAPQVCVGFIAARQPHQGGATFPYGFPIRLRPGPSCPVLPHKVVDGAGDFLQALENKKAHRANKREL